MPYHLLTGRSINAVLTKGAGLEVGAVPLTLEHSCEVIADPAPASGHIQAVFSLSNFGDNPDTKLTLTVRLHDASPVIEFILNVNWRERHKLLKVEFPVAVRASSARYGIQFGAVSRPTHSNNKEDAAMFETCGHRYVDLSEEGYGCAVLCGTKYGYSCKGSKMCLSLLRAPTSPDPVLWDTVAVLMSFLCFA